MFSPARCSSYGGATLSKKRQRHHGPGWSSHPAERRKFATLFCCLTSVEPSLPLSLLSLRRRRRGLHVMLLLSRQQQKVLP